MNRLEEIKERLSYLPRELQDGGFSENSLEYGARLDIEYLLQRLERYEKALKDIFEHMPNSGVNELALYYESIAEEALKEE